MMTSLSKLLVASAAALALSACSEEPDTTIKRGADGQPTGDTGWNFKQEGNRLNYARQVDGLSLTFALFSGSEGVQGQLVATAKPCLGGQGEQSAEDTFDMIDGEEGSVLAEIRTRADEVLGSIADRCDISSEDTTNILAGFDGLYFRTAPERAAVGK